MLVAVDSRDIGHDFAQYFCKQRHHCGNRQHLLLMRACADGLFYASASLASCRNAVIARNDVSRLTAYRRNVELTQPASREVLFCRSADRQWAAPLQNLPYGQWKDIGQFGHWPQKAQNQAAISRLWSQFATLAKP